MKVCTSCHTEQPLANFHKRTRSPDGKQPTCKVCASSRAKTYYDSTPEQSERRKASNDRMRQLAREFIIEYMRTASCVDCGEDDPVVLEFDHVRGTKSFGIAKAIATGYGVAAIEAEIAKCEVRCANCHRRVTASRGGWHWVA